MRSLDDFDAFADPVTLNDCDREVLHLTGRIQSGGALALIAPESGRIAAATPGFGPCLGSTDPVVTGRPLAEVSADLAGALDLNSLDAGGAHAILDFEVQGHDPPLNAIAHRSPDGIVVELYPSRPTSTSDLRSGLRRVGQACATILRSPSFAEAQDVAVRAVREVTGVARVDLYEFQPDWSGRVVAESAAPHMPAYLGLHFPETDIPKQARHLYRILPYRVVGRTDDRTDPILDEDGNLARIDLTWSLLRSVSTMHTAYLRNMDVGSTLSVGLLDGTQLWGLIAAHHDAPGFVAADHLSLVQEIGAALMLRLAQEAEVETAEKLKELRRIENRMAADMRRAGSIEEVIAELAPVLQDFLGADGFAFQFGARLMTSGRTPPEPFIRDLIQWAAGRIEESDQFRTTKLHALYPPAAAHMDTACGVLIQPIVIHRVCQLIWFRGPVTRTIRWAGRDLKDTHPPGTPLTPRTSFETWVGEHRDQAVDWRPSEIASAREMLKELLDIIAAQILLNRENASLRSFAETAAHDIRSPLRGISFALELMREAGFDPDAIREGHEIAEKSAERLTRLITALLDLTVIRNQGGPLGVTDTEKAAQDALMLACPGTLGDQPGMTIGPLPPVRGNRELLTRVFLNLFTNALKFRGDAAPAIRVSGAERDGMVEIFVDDDGTGIPEDQREHVFTPLTRLVTADQVEGSGLGLSICRQIIEDMGGDISALDAPHGGARIRIRLRPAD